MQTRRYSQNHEGKTLGLAFANQVVLAECDRTLNQYTLAYGCDWVRDYLKYSADVEKSDACGWLRLRALCDRVAPLRSYLPTPSLAKRDRDSRSFCKMLQNNKQFVLENHP